ncbi:lactate utilization protein B [uncultured Ferrimonas sp.]|uniref:lactate utilization protein B n=1 Tax=uncultured Ferrimonas sp. TaxID=432640 RepID=UPI002617FD87|nr:lactate utilization protein B [uncultured Ferrimonas sp.]
MTLINGLQTHAAAANDFLKDEARVDWHDRALWNLRHKRDLAAGSVTEWEQIKQIGSEIKLHTLSNLAKYLVEFEDNCKKNGIIVHWAKDGEEHNQIVHSILAKHNVKRLVKSKSMLTEESHLNQHLESKGIDVVDTDLGERIIQLRKEPPSHIVVPAIHLKKEEVGELFHEHLGSEKGASCPTYLTKQARNHLRQKFLEADAALTGVNMAVASEGAVVVCTNEGNADMGVNLPKVQIHCMGIDKMVPNLDSVGVMTRMLARNATGQPITTYSTMYKGPREGGEMHVILVDNGRTELFKDELIGEAYKCIRCGGCLNTCPVYRKSSGFSYNALIPGPIGIAVSAGNDETHSLAWACTLCGSCTKVCPTKVPLDGIIAKWRRLHADKKTLPYGKASYMPYVGKLMANESLLNVGGFAARTALKTLPGGLMKPFSGAWGQHRDLPQVESIQSFEAWFKKNRENK